MLKKSSGVCSVLVLLLCLGGCFGRHATEDARGTLRIALGSEPVSLDPARAEDGVSMKVLGNTMDGLFGYDAAGGLVPRIAAGYTVTPDGLHYAFTLSSDARWSDGKPVTPDDFVAGIRRARAPEIGSKLAPLLSGVRSVRARQGKLLIDLSQPASYFLQVLALTVALPARDDLLRASHGKWLETFPTTGPYVIAEHLPERRIRLEKNPQYRGAVGIPKVVFEIVSDESTGIHLFQEGKLDIVGKLPETEFTRLKKSGRVRIDPFYAVYYLSFNLKKAPFNDRRNRRAIAASVRKDEITQVLQTGEFPTSSWIPRGIEGYFPERVELPLTEEETADIRRKLSQLRPVTAAFDSSNRNRLVMEKIQQDLLAALGMKLSLENMDWKTYIRELQTDAPPLFRFAWLAPLNDPIVHLRVFQTGNPNNYTHFSNHAYDALVEEIARLQPGALRDAKLKQAQRILLAEEAVVVPLYDYVQNHVVAERVQNFRVNPFGVIRFAELGLKD